MFVISSSQLRRDVRDYLRAYTEREGRADHLGTDILSTLYDIAAEVRAFPGHQAVVVLFSDMLQATEEINMEDMIRMPPSDPYAFSRTPAELLKEIQVSRGRRCR